MNDFRKIPRRGQRQAIDGILNAPVKQQSGAANAARQVRRSITNSVRTNGRTVGDFKRTEGYHAAGQADMHRPGQIANDGVSSTSTADTGRKSAKAAPSLLHMTLPGGTSESKAPKGKRDWRKIRKWSLRSGLVVLGLVLILGGFLGIKLYSKMHKVFKGGGSAASLQANVEPSLLKGEGDGRVNILLLGRGGDGFDGADLTDTILLVSIDPVTKKAAMVSLPRDLWITVPGAGSMKINAAFAAAKNKALATNPKDEVAADRAGVKGTENVVSDVLDMPIHYYALVDFLAFRQAIDTIGGVDINVTSEAAVSERLWDGLTRKAYFLNVQPGQQHFDGTRALYFARSRHTSIRGDFDRAERQRLIIQALSQKILSAGTYTNPAKISGLLSSFGDHVSTDMSVSDAVRLTELGKGIGTNMDSLDLADPTSPLVTTGMIGNQSVVRPLAGLSDYSEIQKYVHVKMRDGYLAKENANVTILNGSGVVGLATAKSNQLKYYGYNVGTVGDAPTSEYNKTVIVDLTNGKKPYTKNYLEKRFKVKVVKKIPDTTIQPGTANFVIILGKDASTSSEN
jgi:polyisoprenyl-teichoic acid--peptidoglycan teichoic acid transferase